MPDSIPHLLVVAPRLTPSVMIYIVKPLEALKQRGLVQVRTTQEAWVQPAEVWAADMVLFCRNIEPEQDWILQECLARRIPTVYDLDDNLWEVPPGFAYSEHHRAPQRIAQLERYLRHVQQVRVYSRPLQTRVLEFNPHVTYVLPCIDLNELPTQPTPRSTDKIRLTYVTGRGAADPLIELFAGDLQRLLDEFPGRFEFTWWGDIPERFRGHPDCRHMPVLLDYNQFMQTLATTGFDIGLAPLTPTPFNLSKTNTKFRDYGACHIAGLYSAVDVYTDCVEDGRTGLLVEQAPGAWYAAMRRLADDPALRQAVARNAYAEIDAHYRQEGAEQQWLETIRTLQTRRCETAAAPTQTVIRDPAELARLAPGGLEALALENALDGLSDPTQALQQAAQAVRPGGQVNIWATYRRSPAGLDEHSPRGWSPQPAPVYASQALPADPAGASAQPLPGLDLRCLEIVCCYRPEAYLLSENLRRQARLARPELCEAILFRCVTPTPHGQTPACPSTWFDPPAAVAAMQQERLYEMKAALHDGYARLEAAQQRAAELAQDLAARQEEHARQMPLARRLAAALDGYHSRPLLRLLEALRLRSGYLAWQPPGVQRWADDSLLFGGPLNGYRLRPSLSLTRQPVLDWALDLPRPGLRQVSLMPVFDLFPRQGRLALEVWRGAERLAETQRPAGEVWANTPIAFAFAPLPPGSLRLRLVGRDLDAPLRVYEWQKLTWAGWGRPARRAFVGLEFASQGE